MNGIGSSGPFNGSPSTGVARNASSPAFHSSSSNILDSCVLVSRQVTEERQERVVTRTEFTSHRAKGDAVTAVNGGCGPGTESPARLSNVHSRSSSLTKPIEQSLSLLNTGTGSLSRKTTKTTTVTTSERRTTVMGPDGQPMDFAGVPRQPSSAVNASGDYVAPGQFAGNQRPPTHFPPEHPAPPFDPALVQDPYGYRPTLPPDPSGRRYMNYAEATGPEYEGYPEYGSYGGGSLSGSYHPDYRSFIDRPSSGQSPSERSESPSLHTSRNTNSEYLRTGGYPPGTYDDLETGVPRPEFLSPSANAHPPNYEGGGEDRGNGNTYWNTSSNNNNNGLASLLSHNNNNSQSNNSHSGDNAQTSHYGNLPVRPYLLSEEPMMMEASSSSPSTHGSAAVPFSPQLRSPNHAGVSPESLKAGPSVHHPNHHNSSNHVLTNSPGVRWRDPDLHEVIQFLGNQNPVVKANAAAYLQHLCYMDDPVKAKTRALGGIPPLVALLSHEQPEVHRNACGALRNLSYGRQNDENKKAIKSAGGIPGLIRLLKRTADNEVKELVTGVLWNLSSCEELKKSIIDDGMSALVNNIIIPHSGWDRGAPNAPNNSHIPDPCWSTVFKNASGVIRNVSSAGEYARKKLRECEGLVEALLYVVKSALSRADIDDKSVENCVCILRNLSYRCQEVEDPNYDKHPPPVQSRANATQAKGENLGCFGANKKKKDAALVTSSPKESSNSVNAVGGPTRSSSQNRTEPVKGMELLWQPDVVQSYLALLSNCSNPETLEAAAGAIQNLAACYWQPSIEIRAAVRKEKGLPVLVELLRMEVDRVVCAVATALRNLALDQRNKELIGKYAMRDLVQKLPSGRPHDQNTSDDTIAAVLATLNEVIKKNAEFSRSLMEAEGVERLVLLTQQKRRFSSRVVKFASQVLYSMWQHQELREVYKKGGWTESDFVSKGSGRGGSPGPSGNEASSAGSPVNANSTLNRPMASQSGTRYEDKTMQRPPPNNAVPKSPPPTYPQGEDVPLADMPYPDGGSHAPPPGAFRMYPSQPVKPGEPLYAQVNREKKKNRGFEGHSRGYAGYRSSPSGDAPWPDAASMNNLAEQPGGDSWV